jgi:hypothetical protein
METARGATFGSKDEFVPPPCAMCGSPSIVLEWDEHSIDGKRVFTVVRVACSLDESHIV